MIGPHVFAYSFFVGPVADGFCVLHKCDNPGCVNPQHLYLGDRKDNARDAVQRGRMKGLFHEGFDPRRAGCKNNHAEA
jgi:hypothetical protein